MCWFVWFTFLSEKKLKKLSLAIKSRAIDTDTYFYDDWLSLYHAHLKVSDLNKDTSQPYIYNNFVISLVWEIYNKDYLIKLIT